MTLLEYIFNSNIINILLTAAIVVYLIKKFKVADFIKLKRDEIIQSIKKAEQEKVNQELFLAKARENNRSTRHEVSSILTEADKIADSLGAKIVSDAEVEAIILKQRNEISIVAEKKAAKGEVTKKVAGAAFMIAEEHIKQALDKELHLKFMHEFIDNLDDTLSNTKSDQYKI